MKAGERKARNTRQNITDAASKLFAQKGLDGTSMRDIANDADESLSTIYYYFRDKEDLYYSVLSESTLGTMNAIVEAETDSSGDTI